MPITKIRKEPKVSASNVNVSPGQQLDDTLTAIGAALDAKANAADVAAVTGQRSNLSTTDKSNLVAAVNETLAAIITNYDDLNNKPLVRESGGYKINFTGAEANATNAVSLGTYAIADGEGSHAEGSMSWAIGVHSHAEGFETIAAGSYSHAEGDNTVAYGSHSHAEGTARNDGAYTSRPYTANSQTIYTNSPIAVGTVISDDWESVRAVTACTEDTTEGDWALTLDSGFDHNIKQETLLSGMKSAYGSRSHTEGYNNLAIGPNSHAEGLDCSAMGAQSHAEGHGCVANGNNSHAEGTYTETSNQGEHASGEYNLSTTNKTLYSIGCGDQNTRKNAFEVTTGGKIYVKGIGNYDGTNVTATDVKALGESGWAIGSISYNDLTNKPIVKTANNGYTIGEYAGAMATDAIGLGAGQAIGSLSLAEGSGSLTLGRGSHAEGRSVAAGGLSHAEGATTYSWAPAAHTEGYNTVSMWFYSHAEGSNVLASGLAAHAEGVGFVDDNKITPAKRFHLIVYKDRIEFKNDEGISIHDILYQPVLMLDSDSEQAAPGMPLEVIDYNSVTNVVLLRSHAMYMEGDYALLQGLKSEEGTTITCAILKSGAQGNFSHVEGNNTRALDDGAHAEGIKTKAIGLGSHAEGNNSDERSEVIVAADTVMSDSSSQDTTVTLNSFTGSEPDSANFSNIASGIAIARISYLKNNNTSQIFLRVKGAGVDAETGTPYIVLTYAEETSGYTIPAGSAIEIYYSGALGAAAHAEGYNTAAAGEASHAEGYHTQTTNPSEHAEGIYNLSTPNKTLSSVGIGSGTGQIPRMNAYEVDLQGNFYIKGIGGYDGTNIGASGVKSVQQVIQDLTNALSGNNNNNS